MTDSLMTVSHDLLLQMLAESPDEVRLACPLVSRPVAAELAALARRVPAPWPLRTDLDPVAVAGGYLSPDGLRLLLEAGVEIRSHPDLHAKIYLADDRGVLGSGNLTMTDLGVATRPSLEASVELTSEQVAAARVVLDAWWSEAVVVDHAALRDARERARQVPAVNAPSTSQVSDPEPEIAEPAAALLSEAGRAQLWVKAIDGDEEADWGGDDQWISSSKRGKPSFAPGDLVLIYAKGMRVCNAVVEIIADPTWASEVVAESLRQEEAERWPWLTYVRGRLWVDSSNGITPDDLGFSARGLQGGHRRLDQTEFAAAVRHFAGESVQ